MKNRAGDYVAPLLLVVAGLALIGLFFLSRERPSPANRPTPTPLPTLTPEPIVPTPTPKPVSVMSEVTQLPVIEATDTSNLSERVSATNEAIKSPVPPANSATPTWTPIPSLSATPIAGAATPGLPPLAGRFGVGAAGGAANVLPARAAGLPINLYLTWGMNAAPPGSPNIPFWQMVTVTQNGIIQSWVAIESVIAAQPGAVWIVGNEPDVIWQGNATAEQYAISYHEVYDFIKTRDPAAQIATGGIAQPTPLRLAYLDRVLAAYQATYGEPMPVDIWTVHAFILREEAGSWGVDIPPGMDGVNGRLYEISDHNNIEIFKQSIIDFRHWMAVNGYGDRPLALTEFGILMPPDYGFPPEVVIAFMTQALDFLTSATGETGYGPDNGRLVQWWFWYSLSDRADHYPTGNLFNPATGQLTILGQAYADYVHGRIGSQ